MKRIRFEWDASKAATNLKKHGVSFEEARTVFLDENALLRPDEDHSDDEDRFVLLGLSGRLRTLVVCLLSAEGRGHPLDLGTQGERG